MPTLSISHEGTLIINSTRIQGQVGVISANNAVIMDKNATHNTSGQQRTFTGFDDTKITIPLILYTDTKYAELQKLNHAYKKLSDNQPLIYTLDIPLAKALGVHTALIEDLKTSESEADGAITVTLTLTETDPTINKAQAQQQAQSTSNTADSNTDSPTDTETIILSDADTQLLQGAIP